MFITHILTRKHTESKVHFPDLEVCCDWSTFFPARISRRSLGRKDCVTSQKSVCEGGYIGGDLSCRSDGNFRRWADIYFPDLPWLCFDSVFFARGLRSLPFQTWYRHFVYLAETRLVTTSCSFCQSIVSLAAVFWAVTQRSTQKKLLLGGALRDSPKNGCEGD